MIIEKEPASDWSAYLPDLPKNSLLISICVQSIQQHLDCDVDIGVVLLP